MSTFLLSHWSSSVELLKKSNKNLRLYLKIILKLHIIIYNFFSSSSSKIRFIL